MPLVRCLPLMVLLAAGPVLAEDAILLHCIKDIANPQDVDLRWGGPPPGRIYDVWRAPDPVDISDSGTLLAVTDQRRHVDPGPPPTAFYAVQFNCQDDKYEDNDTMPEATSAFDQWESGLRICEYDDDWFRIYVAGWVWCAMDVTLNFDHGSGNLDLELYGSDPASPIASSSTDTDAEYIHIEYPGGYYHIRVFGVDGAVNTYDMSLWLWLWPYECSDDHLEPNNNVSAASPTDPPVYQDLTLCQDDEDWFALTLARDDLVVLEADQPTEVPFLELVIELRDTDGTTILASDNSELPLFISHTVERDGTYYARVYSEDPSLESGYFVHMEVR